MNTMLHLGLGSFHRAHQGVYLHELIKTGDTSWTLAGGNTRPDMAETLAALAAQGGAYTLETISPAGEHRYERITSIRKVIPYAADLAGLIAEGASPAAKMTRAPRPPRGSVAARSITSWSRAGTWVGEV